MIKVDNVYKRFDVKMVLNGVSLNVRSGETLVIIGSSGVGKSILLKNIIGLIKPDSGFIEINGVNITNCSLNELHKIRKKIGYIFQESALFDSMNIFENVAFGLKNFTSLSKNEIKQRTEQCLAMVGLENVEHLNPSGLSGGMKKRVGFARAIAHRPEYVLYDEPTTGLDPIMSDVINDIIINLKKYLHVTSIVVTHDMNSAYKIADRIMMLYGGNIIFNGTPDEVRNTKNEYVKQFVEGSSHGPIHTDRVFEVGKKEYE
jgi:phospholipid/cholesterol/gamma-HCH transport system ATP-binding protein